MLVIRKSNVVPEQASALLTVDYDFPALAMLREPLLLIGGESHQLVMHFVAFFYASFCHLLAPRCTIAV